MALDKLKESNGKYHKQQVEEERDAAYSQMVQNVERTRAMVRGSISRASTISAEERQLVLTEDDLLVMKKKMTKLIKGWMIYIGIGMQNMVMLPLWKNVMK